jgi:hypothetical protein
VSVGAAITVLALAFEPFFQQSVSFPSRNVVTNTSSISVASSYYPINDIGYAVDSDFRWEGINIGRAVRSAALEVMNALSTANDPVKTAPQFCPTTRCTWANYSTLGVCHKCQDMSRLVVPYCSKDTLQMPGGASFGAAYPCGYRMNNTMVTGISGNIGYRYAPSSADQVVAFVQIDCVTCSIETIYSSDAERC